MLVFWNHRLAYLAMPKTGSSAVMAAYRAQADIVVADPPGLRHMGHGPYWAMFGRRLARQAGAPLETVAVIRDPVDWLGSWYRYRARPGIPDKRRSTAGVTFAAFVTDYLSDARSPMTEGIGDPAGFFAPKQGQAAIDHLFAYEDWAGFQAFLSRRIGPPGPDARINVSPRGDTDLPDPLRQRLEQRLAPAICLHRAALRAGPGGHTQAT